MSIKKHLSDLQISLSPQNAPALRPQPQEHTVGLGSQPQLAPSGVPAQHKCLGTSPAAAARAGSARSSVLGLSNSTAATLAARAPAFLPAATPEPAQLSPERVLISYFSPRKGKF